MPKYGMLILKLGILCLAIGWAISQGVLSQSLQGVKNISNIHLIWAWFCMGVGILLGPLRWCLLLKTVHLQRPNAWLGIRFYYEGLFYNTLLPGSIGGDLLRAHWMKTNDESRSKLHYLVTLSERVLGVISLFFLYVIAQYHIGVAVSILLITMLLFYYKHKILTLIPSKIRARIPLLDQSCHLITRMNGFSLLQAFVVNLSSHLLSFALLVIMAHDLGIELAWDIWFACLSLAMFAANLPISVAGIGPREATLISTLAPYGVAQSQALTLSLAMLALLITHALLGGMMHLVFGHRKSYENK